MDSPAHCIAAAALTVSTFMCGVSFGAVEKPQPAEISGKINWTYDYEEGKRLSRESGKPMFVVFRCER
jgi:hypothetical protein